MIRQSLLLLAALGLLVPIASAVTVKNLYEVTVPVTGQNPDERQGAVRAAFSELLVRLTGDREVLQQPAAVNVLEKADEYVQQYRYGTEERQRQDSMGNTRPTEFPVLTVNFDAQAVHQALWRNRLPVWGRTRPATLVWVAVQASDDRRLLDANTPNKFLRILREYANKRGLPLVFPLMDLQDQVNVGVSDVWANFQEPILKASKRYDTEAVLVGRVFEDVFGGWQGRWHLYESGQSRSWSSQSELLEVVLSEGVEGAADHLGAQYAQVPTGDQLGAIRLSITDVTTLEDYDRASRYLESLAPVSDICIEDPPVIERILRHLASKDLPGLWPQSRAPPVRVQRTGRPAARTSLPH